MKNLNIFSLVTEYENAKSGGVLNVPNVSFVDEDSSVRYLLKNIPTNNGYEYVDLGLPSGLKWATCNVGASSPEQAGLYFTWGETTGYTVEQVNSRERSFNDLEYNSGPAASISTDLTLEYDAAHVNMGGNWRIPTKAEYQELLDNCDVVFTYDYNGTEVGSVFTSKVNSNSLFLPAAGFVDSSSVYEASANGIYWSASWSSSSEAWFLDFNYGSPVMNYNDKSRWQGLSVRGVCE